MLATKSLNRKKIRKECESYFFLKSHTYRFHTPSPTFQSTQDYTTIRYVQLQPTNVVRANKLMWASRVDIMNYDRVERVKVILV